jgi:hypothetical protein
MTEVPKVAANGSNEPIVERKRGRSNWPIMLVAVLFVVVTFLTWHGTWFGRGLSDAELSEYLTEDRNYRHVQQALWQVGERIVKGDTSVRQWYPRLVELGNSPVTEIRQMDAMVMGQDNSSTEFHAALKSLLADSEPIVRRNAALSLIRFGDESGHDEIVSILRPYSVDAPKSGSVVSVLSAGSKIKMGSLLVRINSDGAIDEVRSPLSGTISEVLASEGGRLDPGSKLVTIKPDTESVWEALRGLYLIGHSSDLEVVEEYVEGDQEMPARIKEQAKNTVKAIRDKYKP